MGRLVRVFILILLVLAIPVIFLRMNGPSRSSERRAAARDSSVVAVERSIWENFQQQRWDELNRILGGALTAQSAGLSSWSPASTEALRSSGCNVTSFDMQDVRTREAGRDAVVLAYRAVLKLNCKGTPVSPPSAYYMSVYRHEGKHWNLTATSITQAQ